MPSTNVNGTCLVVLMLCNYTRNAGQLVMGEATYNHIYNGTDSTGSVTRRLHPEDAAHVQEEDQEPLEGLYDEARARSISPEAEAQDGLDALHNAIVSNTDGSVSLNAAGTPTGMLMLRMLTPTSWYPLYRYCIQRYMHKCCFHQPGLTQD